MGPAVAFAVAVSVVIGTLFATGSTLWVATDSGWYLKLAADVAERGDLSNDLFQFRPPAYPMFLAVLFRFFGAASGAAIIVSQHAMVIATAAFAALTAATLRPQALFVATAGLLTAICPYLSGYANTVLTEVPYALLIAAAVFFLVRAQVTDVSYYLAAASATAALAALTKGTGQIAVAVCVGAALCRGVQRIRHASQRTSIATRAVALFRPIACSVVPAATLLLPVMCWNYGRSGHFQLTCALGVELYARAMITDKLGDAGHPALAHLEETLDEAKRRGLVDPAATLRDHHALLSVYPLVHGGSRADAADAMGRAATQLLMENVGAVLGRTLHYAYWMLVVPDPIYRVVPGRMPTDMFDIHEAHAAVERIVGAPVLAQYLPSRLEPGPMSATLATLTNAYHDHIDRGAPILGTGDTLYEELVQVSLLGLTVGLFRRDRNRWLIPAAMLAGHVAISALLVGPVPRYTGPVLFLLWILLALAVATSYDVLRSLVVWMARPAVPRRRFATSAYIR